ncbi:hypothetical protein GCM10010129_43390 [Streptomyces fumigatiscleroticus]|nr:hypothetical protein GCM10010129_43390 [Streptomyces fumigatiscleroticus]
MISGFRPAFRVPRPRAGAPPLGRLVTANALSSVGDGARFAALPLLAAAVTRDVFWVSVVAAAGRAAWLTAPVIGTLVDRMPARRSMVGADLVRCAVLAVLSVSTMTGWVPVPLLVLLALLSGIAEVFFDSAAQAVVPRLAADQELERTNARIIAAQITGTGFLGPPLGAALWAVWQPLPFAVDAVTFLGSALLLRGMPARTANGPAASGDERAERGAGVCCAAPGPVCGCSAATASCAVSWWWSRCSVWASRASTRCWWCTWSAGSVCRPGDTVRCW